MQKFPNETQLILTPGFCIGMALMLLALPFNFIICWFLAILIHELFHYGAIAAFRIPVYSVTLGFNGASLETGLLGCKEELICALSGPLGGLCLVFLVRQFPLLAMCSLIQSGYNLLPIFPLDGGRALRSLLAMWMSAPLQQKVCHYIELAAVLTVCVTGFAATFAWRLGAVPIAAALLLLLKNKSIKTACKQGLQRVQ